MEVSLPNGSQTKPLCTYSIQTENVHTTQKSSTLPKATQIRSHIQYHKKERKKEKCPILYKWLPHFLVCFVQWYIYVAPYKNPFYVALYFKKSSVITFSG